MLAPHGPQAGDRLFSATRWSLVLEADGSQEPARSALAELCRIYWQPLYLYLRRRGFDQHDAQDLVQGFFADVIRKRSYLDADQAKGRFRTFLVGALNHYVGHAQEREHAQKRGGQTIRVPIDEAQLVEAEANATAGNLPSEQLYEHEWAATLLRRTLERLEQECAIAGKGTLFAGLKPHFTANGEADYQTLSRQLGRAVPTLRSDVGRLRARYREILRDEVAATVAQPWEVEDELRYLRQVVAAG
jgi:DNA-directed RNA polymerase specialized sigma24 family protein